jgi:hypothetical protein
MMKRPCECGCNYKDHIKLPVMELVSYCVKCGHTWNVWCYNYRPCGNLEYLEWLSK